MKIKNLERVLIKIYNEKVNFFFIYIWSNWINVTIVCVSFNARLLYLFLSNSRPNRLPVDYYSKTRLLIGNQFCGTDR